MAYLQKSKLHENIVQSGSNVIRKRCQIRDYTKWHRKMEWNTHTNKALIYHPCMYFFFNTLEVPFIFLHVSRFLIVQITCYLANSSSLRSYKITSFTTRPLCKLCYSINWSLLQCAFNGISIIEEEVVVV